MHANGRLSHHPAITPAYPRMKRPADDFRTAMSRALSQRPMRISPKFLYDKRGSELFDQICQLPEYYPTRTELSLLRKHSDEIAALAGRNVEVVEFGAGALRKTRWLLEALDQPSRYLPIDISGDFLAQSADQLRTEFPDIEVQPVIGDYTGQVDLPDLKEETQRIGVFSGSTLGNFEPAEALRFLRGAADLLKGGALLLGADLVKDPALLHAAYNDAQGVTAAFNLNLLHRANRELGTDFNLDAFAHSAFYNVPKRRIEMHLVSRCNQVIRFDGRAYSIDEGESLHTENSYKFTVTGIQDLAVQAGFRPQAVWVDAAKLFSLHWLAA